MDLSGSTFLVTGGTGSLAQAIVPRLLSLGVGAIRLMSRGEHRQAEMLEANREHSKRLRFFIGDVRDKERTILAMKGVDYVIHTAALKRIEACDYNPWEAYATNVGGSWSVISAAIECGVKRVVGISTDKACAPVTTYGATKCFMEHLFRGANSAAAGRTLFCTTRNGNVIGSQGSFLPLLLRQRKTGVVGITDRRMSRFWLPLEWAVDCTLFALENTRGGEVFIRKAPSVRVMEMVEAIAPECRVSDIGLRAQEKLAEELVTVEEGRRTRDAGDYYVIEPEGATWAREPMDLWPLVPEPFQYVSNKNTWRVPREELAAYG